jgi:ATP-binding cassette subfamily B protein
MQQDNEAKGFGWRQLLVTFTDLPRVLRLVWNASPALVSCLVVIMLLQGITPLVNVIVARLLIDGALQGIIHGSLQPLILPVVLQLAVTLVGSFSSRLKSTLEILLNYRLFNYMTLLILRKAGTLDLSFFENAEFYDRLNQVRQDVSNKPLNMVMQLFSLGSSVITMFSLFGLIFQLNWWLALISLLVPVPAFLADSRYGLRNFWKSFWQSPRKRQQWYIMTLLTTDTFNKEIKLFNLVDFFTGRYHDLSEQMYQEDKQLQIKHARISLLLLILPVLADAGIYLYIALRAVQKSITLGALTQYTLAVNQLGQNFQLVLSSLSDLYEYHLFVKMLFDFLAYEPKIVAPAQPAQPEREESMHGLDIEFRNVSYTYPGKNEAALKNINFSICAGESVALVGENGAGKTTLVKLLTRLYDPSEGEIFIGGRNIKEYDPQELREWIGVIFQDYVHYQMTAGENIGIGRVVEMKNLTMLEDAAQKSGADQVIKRLEKGYDAMLGRWFEKGADLSGGEWQKVALARAFMRDAPVLILDEPTSALDAQAEYDIFQRFRSLAAERTVIFISHRFSTVRLADRIFVIEEGRMIESGAHRELLDQQGRYAELFNLQAEAYR